MPKILIRRNSEWANKMRNFEVYLNGQKLADIKDRQLLSFEIPEGKYRLHAQIDWCGSKPMDFEIGKDEIRRFEITGFIFSNYFFLVAIGVVIIYLGVNAILHINSIFLATIMMILFGYMLYFLTFGRNQYLQIREI